MANCHVPAEAHLPTFRLALYLTHTQRPCQMFGQSGRYYGYWIDGTSLEREHIGNHVKVYMEYKPLVVVMVTAVSPQSNEVTNIHF